MISLKLMHLPRGTNRNRTLRRPAELMEDVDLDRVEVEQLFRRFWLLWEKRAARAGTLADATTLP